MNEGGFTMSEQLGKISQVTGPVVDVEFTGGQLPEINTALKITNPAIGDGQWNLVVEVATHLGQNTVRTISMDSTDGLVRGMDVLNTGKPIAMPVGRVTLGRIMNVTGDPVDELGEISAEHYSQFTVSLLRLKNRAQHLRHSRRASKSLIF